MNLKDYIFHSTGMEAVVSRVQNSELRMLPLYLKAVSMEKLCVNNKCFYAVYYEETDGITPHQLEEQRNALQEYFLAPVLFCFRELKSYQRSRLMKRQIAFIVPGRQMYIPFLFIDIKEMSGNTTSAVQKISPVGQLLILYHILIQSIDQIPLNNLSEMLSYSAMSITRAVRELVSIGICQVFKERTKTIKFVASDARLWELSLPYMRSPVKRRVYLSEDDRVPHGLISGEKAMDHFTNLHSPGTTTYAISMERFASLKHSASGDPDYGAVCLEIWYYPPELLASGKYVDPLSLYLTMKDSDDERIQTALTELPKVLKW